MFISTNQGSVICTDCNVAAKRKRDYETEKYRDDPEWYWEPYYYEENFLWICPKCKKEDFISE